MCPFGQTMGLMGQLITFGASSFVDFLRAYFVDYLLNTFTRLYFDFAFNFVIENIEDARNKVKNVVSNVSDIKSFGNSLKSGSSKDKTGTQDVQKPNDVDENDEEQEQEQLIFEEYEPSSILDPDLLDTSYYTFENIQPTPKEISEVSIELPPEQEVEPILEAYSNYANDGFINLYSTVLIGII